MDKKIWQHKYRSWIFLRQTKDGGYIACGGGASGGVFGAYIIKTDSIGNVPTGTGEAVLNNPFELSVNPNPSSGIFDVKLKGLPAAKADIEIYDLNNHCIYHCHINRCSSERINLSSFPSGIYVMLIRMKDNIVSKKIMIQK